jgi:hypothetical protein
MSMSILPELLSYRTDEFKENKKRLLIISEGFEPRSLYWLTQIKDQDVFYNSIICKYEPEKKSRLDELLPLVVRKTLNKPIVLEFNRFEPYLFEKDFGNISYNLNVYDEILIDISVMSKLLVMIIIVALRDFSGDLKIIYSLPKDYSPSIDEYMIYKNSLSKSTELRSSYGVHDVVRTPMLSSITMQRSPSLIVSFLSFNEQLIKAVLTFLNPANLYLVNGSPPHLPWREKAMQEIHDSIIKEYANDNITDDSGMLARSTSTLDYRETFVLLSEIYRKHCFSRRIIVSPTGSKMQAVGCALIKICCKDIHVEYPCPNSYYVNDYSSSEILEVYSITFNSFSELASRIGEEFSLNG